MAVFQPFSFLQGVTVGPTPTPTSSPIPTSTPTPTPTSTPGGLPAWFSNFTFLYDANETTTFTDQSGNGNNGTENIIGSAAITHNAGAAPYWAFTAPTAASDQGYVSSGIALGNYGITAGFTGFIVFKMTTTVGNDLSTFMRADAGNPELQIYKERNSTDVTSRIASSNFPGTRRDITKATNGYNAWNIVFFYQDMTAGTWNAAMNSGAAFSSTTSNTSADTNNQTITVGREAVSSTAPNIFDIGAVGIGLDYIGTSDFASIYNYYDAIYSF